MALTGLPRARTMMKASSSKITPPPSRAQGTDTIPIREIRPWDPGVPAGKVLEEIQVALRLAHGIVGLATLPATPVAGELTAPGEVGTDAEPFLLGGEGASFD
jgi:hypothetical protein